MNHYLLDTDQIIDCLYGVEAAVETLVELAPQCLAVSVITYAELYEGAHYGRNPAVAKVALGRFLADKELLPLTPPIAERFAVIPGGLPRDLRRQIGDMDLLIAATGLTHDLILVTRNLHDFQHIPDLRLHHPS